MARPLRGIIAAGIYHVTRRSAGPIAMFRDDIDRTDFCNRLERTVAKFDWRLHSFVLMTTHYHLLVGVEEDRLQPGMHSLNSGYGREFNLRHGRSGHLRGSPYGSRLIETDDHMLGCVRYIARNPVEAGLCEHPSDWIWGSYRGCAGYDEGFPFVTNDFVLSFFHENVAKAQRLLRIFVETP